jgi:hypothetical protein
MHSYNKRKINNVNYQDVACRIHLFFLSFCSKSVCAVVEMLTESLQGRDRKEKREEKDNLVFGGVLLLLLYGTMRWGTKL